MSNNRSTLSQSPLWGWLIFLLAIVLLVRFVVYIEAVSPLQATGPDPSSSRAIHLLEKRIEPLSVAIEVGETIRWVNETSDPVLLTSSPRYFEPVSINPGESFHWTPSSPSQFQYQSSGHTEQGIFVVVEAREQLFDGKSAPEEYQTSCSSCHGSERAGGVGPALAPDRLLGDDLTYFETIKNGRPGTAMPAWGDQGLSDAEIWLLVGMLHTEPLAD